MKSALRIGLGSIVIFAAVVSLGLNSQVLRPINIELALELAERDPLFGIHGTNPGALRASVKRLQDVVQRVAETYRWEEPVSATMLKNLYPVAFLETLADAEEARLRFLRERSERAYYEYERQVLRAIRQFQLDLATSERIARFTLIRDTTSYAFFGGSITKDDVFRKLEELKKGVRETESLFKNRSRCIRKVESACSALYRGVGTKNPPTLTSLTLPDHILVNRALILDSVVPELNLRDEPYPIVELHNPSLCLSPLGNPLYVLPFRRDGAAGANLLYLHPLNELFFWDAEAAARENEIPYFRAMHENGLRYSYQPTAFYYLCPDNVEVVALVNTLLAIRDHIRLTPLLISSFDVPPSVRGELSRVLRSIAEGDVLRQQEVAWLLAILEQSNFENPLPDAETKERLASLLLMYRERSPNLDWIIEMAISQSHSYLRGREAGYFSLLDPSYLYLSRAPLPFFFLAFNPSIAGSQPPMVQRSGASIAYLTSYSDELRDEFARETVVELFMKQAARFELGLLNNPR